MKTQLLCTFTKRNHFNETIDIIIACNDIVFNKIYVFSNDTNWVNYEAIQSDIFDHLLAILPEFELEIFQNLTGNLASKNN